jgi:hypothetical protein
MTASALPRLEARSGWTNPSSVVSYVTLFLASQSSADAGGQLRTSADTAAHALVCRQCLRPADTGYTVDAGADRTSPKVPG